MPRFVGQKGTSTGGAPFVKANVEGVAILLHDLGLAGHGLLPVLR